MTTMTLLSNRMVYLLAFASAVVTANAYYIHPIISRVATSLDVSTALVGIVPALNQIALALGVLLLLPLGDRVNNRSLVAVCLSIQVIMLGIMATVNDFWTFTAASTVLGFFTITPYLLPALCVKASRAEALRLCDSGADIGGYCRGATVSLDLGRARRDD